MHLSLSLSLSNQKERESLVFVVSRRGAKPRSKRRRSATARGSRDRVTPRKIVCMSPEYDSLRSKRVASRPQGGRRATGSDPSRQTGADAPKSSNPETRAAWARAEQRDETTKRALGYDPFKSLSSGSQSSHTRAARVGSLKRWRARAVSRSRGIIQGQLERDDDDDLERERDVQAACFGRCSGRCSGRRSGRVADRLLVGADRRRVGGLRPRRRSGRRRARGARGRSAAERCPQKVALFFSDGAPPPPRDTHITLRKTSSGCGFGSFILFHAFCGQALEDRERAAVCVGTVCKLLANAAAKGEDAKFRRVRLGNAAIQTKVLAVAGGLEALFAAGFVLQEEGDETVLLLDADFDRATLRGVADALERFQVKLQ